jgi:hypothetical protein
MIFLILLTTNSSFSQDAVKLKMGTEAPFTGFLVTKDRMVVLKKQANRIGTLERLRIVNDDIIEYHKDDAKTQRRKLSQAKFKSNLYNIGYFCLGVILSSYAFKVSQEINK